MSNNTPDYEDNLFFDCNKTQANDLARNKISLTEQWKKGELPDGYYYCKLILNNMKPSVERCKAHCIPMGVSADKGEQVLAPVPSYEEWQAKLEENAQLKELLKRAKIILEDEGDYMIVQEIDEALR